MKYDFSGIISGKFGYGLKATALSALNFELSRQVANHPTLKMPTEKVASPDDLRAKLTLPELEGRDVGPQKLDVLLDGLVATCALVKDLASHSDYDSAGRITHPYRYLIDRVRTPIGCIESNFAWRADMAAKVAGEQAALLGVDAKKVEENARKRSMEQNQERMNYALAEVNSNTNLKVMDQEESFLLETLIDLNQNTFDGMKLIQSAAQAELQRAKRRLEQGLYTVVDEEVILFAKSPIPE